MVGFVGDAQAELGEGVRVAAGDGEHGDGAVARVVRHVVPHRAREELGDEAPVADHQHAPLRGGPGRRRAVRHRRGCPPRGGPRQPGELV